GGEDEAEANAGVEETATEAGAVIRFMLGVEDALRSRPPAAPKGGATGPGAALPVLRDAVAQVFGAWPAGDLLFELGAGAAALGKGVGEFFTGWGSLWRDLVDGFFQTAPGKGPDQLPDEAGEGLFQSEESSTASPESEGGAEQLLPEVIAR